MRKVRLHNIEFSVRMLKIMAHPVRLRIIMVLINEKRLSVGSIQRKLKVAQSTVSQHLTALKNVGVLACDKDNNIRYYYILDKRVYKFLRCLETYTARGG